MNTMTEPGGKPVRTLLVANRGEIADRVIRTAQSVGLRTVAVYSDADRGAPYVARADTAVHLGPTAAAESYLNIERIIDAARRSGADAIHPGYGFLSERAEFARSVTDAGLTFVGPTAEVMDVMARKDHAREIAIAAGVPVVPSAELPGEGGSGEGHGRPSDVEATIGFPVLVKAAAGGGGKGMRIVHEESELAEALAAARREAAAAFGDDTMLIERYVENGRHVEVQVLGDEHGNVIHLFDRDCSVQRRHQKVLEEAPAPTISDDLRRRLTSAAVALARQVGYTNAGTVEFLVSGEEFFFLEMNTRLQVEAPVTEAVTGLDLVELQLLVASGAPLPIGQDDVHLSGHAIEVRVYAEDAFAGFLPQAGVAEWVHWPTAPAAVHESFRSGQEVTTAYDPMLAKIVVHAADRAAARDQLVRALDDSVVLGVTTNLGFLRALVASPEFADAAVHTSWLDTHPGGIAPPDPDEAVLFAAAAVAGASSGDPGNPFGFGDGWRSAGPPAPTQVRLEVEGESRLYSVAPDGAITVEGEVVAHIVPPDPDRDVPPVVLEIDGLRERAHALVGPHAVEASRHGHTHRFARPDAFAPGAAAGAADGVLLAPMPGTVLAVDVVEGEAVQEGQRLGVLEAMKMELALRAPHAGTVERVGAVAGAQVALGEVLFSVTPQEVEQP